MRVRDIMSTNPATVQTSDTLHTARELMETMRCRRLPVLDATGNLCGILTDRDVRLALNSPLVLRERWQDDLLLHQTRVDACMTPDPITIEPDTPVQQAIDRLLEHRISGLPVVESAGALVGVVTVTDLIRALAQLLEASGEAP